MATLQQIQEFVVGEPELFSRFKAARLQCAWDVLDEPTAPAEWMTWAEKIFRDYDGDAAYEYRWCLSHPSIQDGTATDDAVLIAAVYSFIGDWSAAASGAATASAPAVKSRRR